MRGARATAVVLLATLAACSPTAESGPAPDPAALLARAEALERAGAADAALACFRAATGAKDRVRAFSGAARGLAATGAVGEAARLLDEVAAKASPEDAAALGSQAAVVRAAAWDWEGAAVAATRRRPHDDLATGVSEHAELRFALPDVAALGSDVVVEEPWLVRPTGRAAELALGPDGMGGRVFSSRFAWSGGALRVDAEVEIATAKPGTALELIVRRLEPSRSVDSVTLGLEGERLVLAVAAGEALPGEGPRARTAARCLRPTRLQLELEVAPVLGLVRGRVTDRAGAQTQVALGAGPFPGGRYELVVSLVGPEVREPARWPIRAPERADVTFRALVTSLRVRAAPAAGVPAETGASVALAALQGGHALLARGRPSDAALAYRAALEPGPALGRARTARALALLEAGRAAEAALDLAEASAQDARARAGLAHAVEGLIATGELAKAAEAALQGARAAPEDAVAANFERATAERVRQEIERDESRGHVSPDDRVRHARALAALTTPDDLARARAECDKALAASPRHLEAYLARGDASRAEGILLAAQKNETAARAVFEQAILDFQRAREMSKDDARVYLGLGKTLYLHGNARGAIAMLRRAVALDAGLADGWHFLGRALLDEMKLDEAAAALDRAVALRPTFGWSYVYRAKAREESEPGRAKIDVAAAWDLGLWRSAEVRELRARVLGR